VKRSYASSSNYPHVCPGDPLSVRVRIIGVKRYGLPQHICRNEAPRAGAVGVIKGVGGMTIWIPIAKDQELSVSQSQIYTVRSSQRRESYGSRLRTGGHVQRHDKNPEWPQSKVAEGPSNVLVHTVEP
jgi:hypothetical protein